MVNTFAGQQLISRPAGRAAGPAEVPPEGTPLISERMLNESYTWVYHTFHVSPVGRVPDQTCSFADGLDTDTSMATSTG